MHESKYHANMVELSLPGNRLEVGFNPDTVFEVVTTVEDADEYYVAVVGYLWRENVTRSVLVSVVVSRVLLCHFTAGEAITLAYFSRNDAVANTLCHGSSGSGTHVFTAVCESMDKWHPAQKNIVMEYVRHRSAAVASALFNQRIDRSVLFHALRETYLQAGCASSVIIADVADRVVALASESAER